MSKRVILSPPASAPAFSSGIIKPQDSLRQRPRWSPIRASGFYEGICRIEATFPSGARGHGTGWAVSNRVVITAGHCVHNNKHGGKADRVSVKFPSRERATEAQPVLVDHGNWKLSTYRLVDIASLVLDNDAPVAMPWGSVDDLEQAKNRSFQICGFLSASASGRYQDNPCGPEDLCCHSGLIVETRSPRLVYYDIDVDDGQSGGPIMFHHDREMRVVGHHTVDSIIARNEVDKYANGGVLYDNYLADQINNWANDSLHVP